MLNTLQDPASPVHLFTSSPRHIGCPRTDEHIDMLTGLQNSVDFLPVIIKR
jgi:hypothetical protein